jgi:polyvinyl alcohol dehydrogenase (cytochrome)
VPAPRIGLRRAAISVIATVFSVLVCAAASFASGPAWSTYDHDAARSAIDPDSTSPVAPTPAWTTPVSVDGGVYGQPLVYGLRVYVATENDTIYALKTATGAIAWKRHLATAVPAGDLPCGNIKPTVGITGTPVVDPATSRIYAVTDELVSGTVHHRLWALSLTGGTPVPGFPIALDPPGADPTTLLQRAALALDQGRVIAGFGGNGGDCGDYHGWLVSAPGSGAGATTYFKATPKAGDHGGAIWGSGDGPSQDTAGNLFAATGNGFSSSSTPDLQESVVRVDANLTLHAHWTASNWKSLDTSDQDLGSSEPLPLPDHLLFEIGKDGVGRLLVANALGTTGQVFSANVCASAGSFGASMYVAGTIYVPCATGLAALSLSLSPSPTFTLEPGFKPPAFATGPPILAGGLVWSTGWRFNQRLYGLNPGTGAQAFSAVIGSMDHFATPSAGGGRLFVAARQLVSAFTIAHFPPAAKGSVSGPSTPARASRRTR